MIFFVVAAAEGADGELAESARAPEDRGHHDAQRALPQDVHRVRQEL